MKSRFVLLQFRSIGGCRPMFYQGYYDNNKI